MIGDRPLEGAGTGARIAGSWRGFLDAAFGSGQLWAGVLWGAMLGAALVMLFHGPTESLKIGGLMVLAASLAGIVSVMVRGLRQLLLIVVLLDTVMEVDFNLFYRPDVGDLGGLGGLNLSATTLALAGLYGAWLIGLLGAPRTTLKPLLAGAASALVYAVLVAVVAIFANDPVLAAFEVGIVLQALLVFVYLVSTVRSRWAVKFIIATLFVGLIAQSVITIASGVMHMQFDFLGVSNHIHEEFRTGRVWRAGGTLGSPNAAAALFVVLLAPAFAIGLSRHRSTLTLLAQVSFGLGLVALVVTRSRGGWISLGIACLLVLVVMAHRRNLSKRAVAMLVGAALIALPFALPLVASRIQSDDDGALASRGPLNAMAFRMIGANPILGVGPNNFAAELPNYTTAAESGAWLFTVHNQYLLVWSEGGILVFLAFLLFLATGLLAGLKTIRRGDDLLATIALGLTAGLVGRMLHMTVDLIAARPAVQTLWVTIAVLTVLAMASGRGVTTVGSCRGRASLGGRR